MLGIITRLFIYLYCCRQYKSKIRYRMLNDHFKSYESSWNFEFIIFAVSRVCFVNSWWFLFITHIKYETFHQIEILSLEGYLKICSKATNTMNAIITFVREVRNKNGSKIEFLIIFEWLRIEFVGRNEEEGIM